MDGVTIIQTEPSNEPLEEPTEATEEVVEVVTDAAVEVAQIEAERDCDIAETNAEVAHHQIEASQEIAEHVATTDERIEECRMMLTDLGSRLTAQEERTLSILEKLEERQPMNLKQEQADALQPDQLAQDEQAHQPEQQRAKPNHRWI